jgi:alpha-D-xyloside xylohydrolase
MNREFGDNPWALISDIDTTGEVEIREHQAVLRSGDLEATVSPYGRIRFLSLAASSDSSPEQAAAKTLLEEVDWRPDQPQLMPLSREFVCLDGELFKITARFVPHPGERFFGLGQHRHGLLDQKGSVVELMQRNSEVCIPFLVSSRGFGFLWNNPSLGRVELGTNGTRWVAEASRQLDYLVMTGSNYAEILERYVDATGHAPLLPKWAAGFWQSKLRYRSQSELLGVAEECRRRGIPLAVIVVDFFHWTRQGDWRWDPEAWPDPQGLIRELKRMGTRLMVSIWPTVNPRSANATEMRDRGLLVGTNRGLDVLFPFEDPKDEPPVFMHYYDATNPEARQFIWERCRESYFDKGVELFWLDACEPEIRPLEHRNLRFFLGTGTEVGCIYPLMHARAFYEGMKKEGAGEIINLCRSAWAGSQRYGVAVWSGDINSDWETLRIQVRAGLNLMMSGIPWWTTDIGGFHGGNIHDPDFQELIVRWFQYGVFCPLFRLHGYRQPASEGLLASGADNEVWSFGEKAYGIIRELIDLRLRIRPYIMNQMHLASARGVPPMRPLFFDYSEEQLYSVDDEFLLGPDLIVAPVLEHAARERAVFLPWGANWVDGWTGDAVPHGEWFTAKAPLDVVPVFRREGSLVRLA